LEDETKSSRDFLIFFWGEEAVLLSDSQKPNFDTACVAMVRCVKSSSLKKAQKLMY